ncbi:hypothetical protein [Klebsiella variicola]|nr:hypothetical protein [Klebsiella variicola]
MGLNDQFFKLVDPQTEVIHVAAPNPWRLTAPCSQRAVDIQ